MASAGGGNPSRRDLLDTAVRLLAERGEAGFTVDEVLIESGTSSSSLYHHFGNRQGLIDAAQDELYRRLARAEDRGNLEGGYAAATPEAFLDYVAGQIRRIVSDPETRTVRRRRIEVLARSFASPELSAERLDVQERMVDVIAAMFAHAQERGLINPDLDTRAYTTWFHGCTLSRTVTEEGSVTTDAWLAVAIPAALAPLRLPEEHPPA